MTYRQRREALGLTAREFGIKAKMSSSTVWKVEKGENCHTYTLNRYKAALKDAEAAGPVRAEYPRPGPKRHRGKLQGRRRPDFAAARKMLGMTQGELAAEFKVEKHEISKIESGYDKVDPVNEEIIDGYLREQIKARNLEWPVIKYLEPPVPCDCTHCSALPPMEKTRIDDLNSGAMPTLDCAHDYQEAIKQGVKPGALDRLKDAVFPVVDICQTCRHSGVVFNPRGVPHICPVCEGRGTVREGFYK